MFGWKFADRTKPRRAAGMGGSFDGGYEGQTQHEGQTGGAMSGIVAGTRVATAMGWRDVAALQAGDMVLTFDGGLQPLVAVRRRPMWHGEGQVPQHFWPLHVPTGALDNAAAMLVLPRQGVMLESDLAEDVLGDPFALIPAAALEGARGIERVCPDARIEAVTLEFETDQVVFAERGALLFCPASGDLVQFAVQAAPAAVAAYRMLPESCAIAMVHGTEGRGERESCLDALRATFLSGVGALRAAA